MHKNWMIYGSARVSTDGQSVDAQVQQLRAAGAGKIYRGRARAVARSVKMGRKPKLTPHQRGEAIKRRSWGAPVRDIGRSYNISHSTISRLVP